MTRGNRRQGDSEVRLLNIQYAIPAGQTQMVQANLARLVYLRAKEVDRVVPLCRDALDPHHVRQIRIKPAHTELAIHPENLWT